MRIILVGFGNVGQCFVRLVSQRLVELVDNFGIKPRIVGVIDRGGASVEEGGLDLNRLLKIKIEKGSVASDAHSGKQGRMAVEVIEEMEAEVVVEATNTNLISGEPAMSHIEAGIRSGKHVISSNKGPLALALPALTELAEYNNVLLRFSGTVGGGTPILDFGRRCLASDHILSIRGILNGTTNYILSKMSTEWMSFEEALETAQRLGYAEADPSIDIDGIDSACKLVIMANWVLERRLTLKDVEVKGIRDIKLDNLRAAQRKGNTIKLVGSIADTPKVEPVEISKLNPLCVDGTLNAVTFTTETSGDQTIIGRGAGGMETASSILRDLLDIRKNI